VIKYSQFDRVLKHKKINEYIVSNTYLHFINEHPQFLKQYNLSSKEKFEQSIRFRISSLIRIFQAIFFKESTSYGKNDIKSDILFVSHLTNKDQFFTDEDPYFGDLPTQLLEHNFHSAVAFINHIKANNSHKSKVWNESRIFRHVLSINLDFFSEIKLQFFQRKAKKQLNLIFKDLKIDKELAKDILMHHLSSSSFSALRIAMHIANIVKLSDIKYVVTTFEGHSWERLVYFYVRKVNPEIKCFGYQHSAVFKRQHAIKRSLNHAYNPDAILTSGNISKNLLRDSKSLKQLKIVCLGSPKYSEPRLIKDKLKCCLVVPEGTIKDCLSLFKLSYIYAVKNQNQKFIWRLHPLISFEDLKRYSNIFKKIPNNIFLSEVSLDEDVKKSDTVLYSGSTAVVNAISSGLMPIYYQKHLEEFSIDPIYLFSKGKQIVFNQNDLRKALSKSIDIEARQSLQNFAQEFYTPLNVKTFKELIS
jgi:hypothetical protein